LRIYDLIFSLIVTPSPYLSDSYELRMF